MLVTRSSGVIDTDDFVMQMDNYIKSSEVFKSVIVSALNSVISETLKPLQVEIQLLKSKNEALRCELAEVKAKFNDNEQYSRRNNIRIFGLHERSHENCYDVVLNLCGELDIDISRNELDRAHRVGRVLDPNSGNAVVHPRPVIVKLISHQSKLKLMKARKNLKGKDIFIREDLTKANHALLMFVRRNCIEDPGRKPLSY